jgi:hypothetical protein
LDSSDKFGPMMAAEADARGFFAAKKKAFVGDGLGYNWTIQQRWFPGFVPINDFLHVVEYAYSAAKVVHEDLYNSGLMGNVKSEASFRLSR